MGELSASQAEMEKTGQDLDQSQKSQLNEFMDDLVSNQDISQEEKDASKEKESGFKNEAREERDNTFDEGDEEGDEEGDSFDEESEQSNRRGVDEEGEDPSEDGGEFGSQDSGGTSQPELIALRAELAEQKKVVARLLAQSEEKKEEVKIPEITFDGADFLTEDDVADIMLNPREVLTKLAEKVYLKAREDTMKDIPRLVESGARRQTALANAQDKFRSENADLLEAAEKLPAVARLIRITADEIQSTNPDWTIERVFTETGQQVRSAIKLGKKAQEIEKSVTTNNNQLRKPKGTRKSPGLKADKRSGLQKDLDAMLDTIR